MKKIFVAALASSFAFGSFAQEEAAVVEESNDSTVAKGINHWSLGIQGGINYMKGAPNTDTYEKLRSEINGQFGLFGEYTFNPRWGLGLEYMYALNNQDVYFDAVCHDINLYASFNISNIVAPYRSAGLQRLNIYFNPGVLWTIGTWKDSKIGEEEGHGFALGLKAAGVLEVNVSNWVAVGLNGDLKARIRKTYAPECDRLAAAANLFVRIKFGGERNIRNVSWVDYAPGCDVPDLTPILDEQKRQCEELTSKLEEQIVNQNVAINKLQQQIKFTQDSLDSHIRATREPVKYVPTKEEDEIIKTAFAQLEFESSKAIIKQVSYSSLDGLAMLLKSHPEWSVILKGYTDNSGNAAKNLQLSKDRAASVKNYLIKKGVNPANIQSQGYGSANPIASNSTLDGRAKNRRVEIELFSK